MISIRRNASSRTTELGIDLDRDFAVNRTTRATRTAARTSSRTSPRSRAQKGTLVEGTLDSTPSTSFDIKLFRSNACDDSGNGEGEEYLGDSTVDTDESGKVDFAIAPPRLIRAT